MRTYEWTVDGGWKALSDGHVYAHLDVDDTALEAQGYYCGASAGGDEVPGSLAVWVSRDGQLPYVCFMDLPGSYILSVFIPDDVSMIEFWRRYAQGPDIDRLAYTVDALQELMEKLFRVYHGHDPLSPCRECDPYGFDRLVESRKRRLTLHPKNE